jgi:uncharacterized delta-60 repeat protein
MKAIKTILLGGLAASLITWASAQHEAPGEVDLSFSPGISDRTGGYIYSILVQGDGRVLIGGSFGIVRGLPRSKLARLEADGTVDPSFDVSVAPGLAGDSVPGVFCILQQPDEKILIGGSISAVNGVSHNGVARLNTDGSLDLSFDPGQGVQGLGNADIPWINGKVSSMALQSDGKVLVAGGFSSVAGVNRSSVARLNADGTLDATFNPAHGSHRYIATMALQPDGKVLIGGFIRSSIGEDARPFLARLNADGSDDSSFSVTFRSGDGTPRSIAMQADGRTIVSGGFYRANEVIVHGLARFHPDGTVDDSFYSMAEATQAYGVWQAALQPDGKLILGITKWRNEQFTDGVIRLNEDGSIDGSFPEIAADYHRAFTGGMAIALQDDGKVLISGIFNEINGVPRKNLARLTLSGEVDPEFNAPRSSHALDGPARSILVQADGKMVVGGINYLVRMDEDGVLDPSFNPAIVPGDSPIAQQPDGKLITTNTRLSPNAGEFQPIARLHPNGTLDETFRRPEMQMSGGWRDVGLRSLALQRDGKILVGGFFDRVDGVPRMGMARLEAGGRLDTSFAFNGSGGIQVNGIWHYWINQIALQPDGKILVVGTFQFVDGVRRSRSREDGFARLNADGSLDHEFAPVLPANFAPLLVAYDGVAVQSDGKILIACGHTTDSLRHAIFRLHADGTMDPEFKAEFQGGFQIASLLIQPDGKVLVAAANLWSKVRMLPLNPSINGVIRHGLARLNPDGSVDMGFDPGTGPDGGSLWGSLALQPDGKILLGGNFALFNGVPRPHLVRLYGGGIDVLPPLSLTSSGQELVLTWPVSGAANAVLEFSDSLSPGAIWAAEPATPVLIWNQQVLPIESSAPTRFYRLRAR